MKKKDLKKMAFLCLTLVFTTAAMLGSVACSDDDNDDDDIDEPVGQIESFTVNGVSFRMMPVQGGTFTMGATPEQGNDSIDNEKPTHSVTLSSYWIGETEVTQELWQAVMGRNPSEHRGSNMPVEMVSWDDCQNFIRKLDSITGKTFRLPTEAEWEYAARGGNKSRGYKYAGSNAIGEVAWYDENSENKPQPVKGKNPNELGLYDMSGNVLEWCKDWHGAYGTSPQTNPQGPSKGSYHVIRGGSSHSLARNCRVSDRSINKPFSYDKFYGLRLALVQ